MKPSARVCIQTADFDLSAEVARLRAGDGGVGAVFKLRFGFCCTKHALDC